MTEEIINVSNMKCQGCANAVKQGVMSLAGVSDVQVDLEKARMNVKYDPGVSHQEIVEKLAAIGYPAVS